MRNANPPSTAVADLESLSPSGPFRALKQFGLVLLCAAWVALGLAGHDPWKTEDAVSIGVAAEMAARGDAVVPTLAGEPYLGTPPLAWVGGALALTAFSPPLKPHNAARLVAGVALALVLLATALASRELNGRGFRWLPVLILVGSIGLYASLTHRNPSVALTLAAGGLPFLTFYAITEFLLHGTLGVCFSILMAYGFTTVAMLIPAISEFDTALGRSTLDKG